MRFHLSLNVPDLTRAIDSYAVLFGQPPSKRHDDYAKFDLADPPVVYRGSFAESVPLPTSKPRVARLQAPAPVGPAWFRAMDRNGDGFVSADEFRGPPGRFAQLDQNADGRISAAEADKAGR
ncbi:MAG: hypothetical protein U0840_09640 [Gemmataceae bacterium]